MEIISNPTQVEIKKAAQALKEGHLVAFPTETVYGLGADANNEVAIRRIYEVKGRPNNHPLIVHIASVSDLDKWTVKVSDYAKNLASAFWPGPMTLILARSKLANNFITGWQDNVGIRVPSHPIAQALLMEFQKIGGNGIAAPSANRFGAVSPTTVDAVQDELEHFLNKSDLVLNGGSCDIGLESTIINCTGDTPTILRSGAITKRMIEIFCDIEIGDQNKGTNIKTSGMLRSHYSPKAKVVLDSIASTGDGLVALAEIPTPSGCIRLLSPKTIEEFARNFYGALRLGDKKNLNKIVIILPSGEGLAEAIRDRSVKASAGR